MVDNPKNLITILLDNQTNQGAPDSIVAQEFKNTLIKYNMYNKAYQFDYKCTGIWHSIKNMIDQGKNLFFVTDIQFDYNTNPWYIMLISKYDQKNVDELIYESINGNNCQNYKCYWCQDQYASNKKYALFLMSHAITLPLNVAGCAYIAKQVNKYDNLLYKYNNFVNYIQTKDQTVHNRINYIGIDFFQLPNLDRIFFQTNINGLDIYE